MNTKTYYRVVLTILLLAAMMALCAWSTDKAFAAGPNVTQHSKEEIAQYLEDNNIRFNDKVTFQTTPVKNTTRGELTDASKQSALKTLNAVRYIAGLEPVSLNTTQGSKAQAAAFVDWSIGKLTHHPNADASKPANMSDTDWTDGEEGASHSNIAYGRDNLSQTIVQGWLADNSSASNVENIGHRRWCLNPAMGTTGFGATTGNSATDRFYAMWSFDDSANGTQKNVVWPAQNMPVEFFDNNTPWSLSTGDTSITNLDNIQVTLSRREASPSGTGSWTFSTSKNYTPAKTGEYFGVQENDPYKGYSGQPGPFIVFRPANIAYQAGDIFDVTVTGLGSETINYTVEFFSGMEMPKSINECEYVGLQGRAEYTGAITEPEFILKDGDYQLVQGKDFETFYPYGEPIEPDDTWYFAFFRGIGNYGDSTTSSSAYFQVVPKTITQGMINISPKTFVWTGGVQKPDTVIVKNGDTVLQEGVDYTLSNPGGQSVGSFKVKVTAAQGSSHYTGSAEASYTITPKPLTENMITVTCAAGKTTPTVTVKDGEETLRENTHYTLTCSENTVTVTGINNYGGEVTIPFTTTPKPVKASLEEATVTTTPQNFVYNGSAQVPETVTVTLKGVVVPQDAYTVNYTKNTGAGKAEVTITAKDDSNYTGSATGSFTISPRPITADSITVEPIPDQEYKNGEVITPPVTVRDGDTVLSSDDYDVSYENNKAVGTATVRLTGKGNYSGERNDVTFQIVQTENNNQPSNQGQQNPTPTPAPAPVVDPDAALPTAASVSAGILKQKSDSDPKGAAFLPLTLKSSKQAKNAITLSWKKTSGASYYEVYGALSGKKFKKLTASGSTSFRQKKLKAGTYYKYLVVAVKKSNSGDRVLSVSRVIHVATRGGKVANPTSIRVTNPKKGKATLKRKKTLKIAATIVGKNVRKRCALRFESSNPAVATVSGKGAIKGLKKGKADIYVIAQNGLNKKVSVTVK